MSRVLVFGSINMDLVVETNTFPRLGETLPGASFATHAGGKGANQAVAAARLGARRHARASGRRCVRQRAQGALDRRGRGYALGPRDAGRVDRDRGHHGMQCGQRHRRRARRQRQLKRGRSRRGGAGVRGNRRRARAARSTARHGRAWGRARGAIPQAFRAESGARHAASGEPSGALHVAHSQRIRSSAPRSLSPIQAGSSFSRVCPAVWS